MQGIFTCYLEEVDRLDGQNKEDNFLHVSNANPMPTKLLLTEFWAHGPSGHGMVAPVVARRGLAGAGTEGGAGSS